MEYLTRHWTDERVDYLQVTNTGGSIFEVWLYNDVNNNWGIYDCFTRYAEEPETCHSANSAEKAVVDWFNDFLNGEEE